MIKKRVSLQNKLTFSIVIFSVIAIFIVGYMGYSEAKKVYIDKIIIEQDNDVENIVSSIKDKISIMKQDANLVSNFYTMQKLLNWEDVGVKEKIYRWDNATKNTFKSMISSKDFYYKIRILDLNGMEKITVHYDQVNKKVVVQSADKLQNRVNQSYYKDAKDLKLGEVYVSQMELNSEFGKVIKPYVPIVHFSSVIYNKNGEKRGIAVVNAYAKNITDTIQKINKREMILTDKFLIDKDGYYYVAKDKEKLWGKQLDKDENFKNDYPKVFELLTKQDSGSIESDDKLFNFQRIYLNKKDKSEYWTAISQVQKAAIYGPLNEFENSFLLILLTTVLALILFIKMVVRKIVNPLSEVTKHMQSLSVGELNFKDIDYSADDEIRDLIESSKRLVKSVKDTIIQAKDVASGDFTKRLKLNSNKDELSIAINEMTNMLEKTSKIAQQLSHGDIDIDIVVKNEKDTLSIAIKELIKYLQEITKIAESISMGDFDVSFKPAGDDDRLGDALTNMTITLKQILKQTNLIASGNYSKTFEPKNDNDKLGISLVQMTNILESNRVKNELDNWLKDGLSELSKSLSGLEELAKLSNITISSIVKHVEAASGVIFLYNHEKDDLYLQSSYAFVEREALATHFKKGDGIIGQVALEQKPILLKNVSKDEFNIQSGIVNKEPKNIYASPIIYEGKLIGVIEVASFNIFDEKDKRYMDEATKVCSAFFYNLIQNRQIKELLEESQRANEELQVQSEELQQTNVQMEEQQQQLEQQSNDLKNQNNDLQKAKKDLDTRAKELERSSQYKSEFLANMSHELRTPLNSIILLSKMLSEDKSNEDEQKKANVIHQSGQDLLLLINDILDLSKVESGNMELSNEEFSTAEIISQSQDLFNPIASQKGVEFIVDDKLNSTIEIDRIKLMQVIKNLLSNAFKFTKDGSVTLRIESIKDKSLGLKISVTDTGIGISKDKKEMIFEAFKQVDGSISRNYGGTGLGLSISKKFIELMGGVLSVQSKEGEGSEFIIKLPLDKTKVKDIPKIPKTSDTSISRDVIEDIISEDDETLQNDEVLDGKVILITDDDSRNIFSLSALLQRAGAKTLHALNGLEAIEILKDKEVDLVLMDIMMPKMDGYTTIKHIRERLHLKDLPIIAVTAKAMKEDKQKCIDAGANDYMAKPIESESLLMMVKAWVSR